MARQSQARSHAARACALALLALFATTAATEKSKFGWRLTCTHPIHPRAGDRNFGWVGEATGSFTDARVCQAAKAAHSHASGKFRTNCSSVNIDTGDWFGYKPTANSTRTPPPGHIPRSGTLPGGGPGHSDPLIEQTVSVRSLGTNLNVDSMYRAELAKAKASGYRPSRYEKEFARELGISAEQFMEIEIRREAQEAYGRGMTIEALQEEKHSARLAEEQAKQRRLLEEARRANRILDDGMGYAPRVNSGSRALPGSEGFSGLPGSRISKPCPPSKSRGSCVSPQ